MEEIKLIDEEPQVEPNLDDLRARLSSGDLTEEEKAELKEFLQLKGWMKKYKHPHSKVPKWKKIPYNRLKEKLRRKENQRKRRQK